jgi:hypothetical protein
VNVLLAIAKQILTIVGQILGVVQALQGINTQAAVEHSPYTIETAAYSARDAVIHPVSGNPALYAKLLDVLSAIDVPNSVVVLPPTPPVGYGGGDPSETWNTIIPIVRLDGSWGSTDTARNNLVEQTAAAILPAQMGYRDSRSPSFALTGASPGIILEYVRVPQHGGTYTPPAEPDWTAWNGIDDLVTFLLAQSPGFYWDYYEPMDGNLTPTMAWAGISSGHGCSWRCVVETWMLPLVSGRLTGGGASLATPPVWPGLAAVTLGTPVALDTGLTITEPMDGVLVAITSVPGKHSGYTYDDIRSYVHIGALAFFSDNGDMESYQPLSFTAQVYRTRTMARAAGVKVMTPPDVVGTITPWVVT